MMETEERSDRKAWAILTGRKILTFIPHVLDIVIILGCGLLIMQGATMFRENGDALKMLIDAGELPSCLYYYPLGIMGMFAGLFMLMWWMNRRRKR